MEEGLEAVQCFPCFVSFWIDNVQCLALTLMSWRGWGTGGMLCRVSTACEHYNIYHAWRVGHNGCAADFIGRKEPERCHPDAHRGTQTPGEGRGHKDYRLEKLARLPPFLICVPWQLSAGQLSFSTMIRDVACSADICYWHIAFLIKIGAC